MIGREEEAHRSTSSAGDPYIPIPEGNEGHHGLERGHGGKHQQMAGQDPHSLEMKPPDHDKMWHSVLEGAGVGGSIDPGIIAREKGWPSA